MSTQVEPSSLPNDLPRFTPDGVSYRCKRHGWMDAEGGMCPSCVRYQVGDLRGAFGIRATLLAMPRDERPAFLREIGVCPECGKDTMDEEGEAARCHCRGQ